MKYQVSIDGSTTTHEDVQFYYLDTDNYQKARNIALDWHNLIIRGDPCQMDLLNLDDTTTVKKITVLFRDRAGAIADGVDPEIIEEVKGNPGLYRAWVLKK